MTDPIPSNADSVLTRLNVNNPILRIFSEYGTPQEVKNFALSVLAPYFRDQGMLNTLALPVLVTEAVNVARLQSTPAHDAILRRILDIYRKASAVDSAASRAAVVYWEASMGMGQDDYISLWNLDFDSSTLPLLDFRFDVFRKIGSLIEAVIQPYLRELLCQLNICENRRLSVDYTAALKLGKVVNWIKKTPSLEELVCPEPWRVSLHHWRNMAHHKKTRVEGNEIVGVFGLSPNEKEIRLSKTALAQVLSCINARLSILKGARALYCADSHVAQKEPAQCPPSRPEVALFLLHSAMASQGFQLVSVNQGDRQVRAVIRDCSLNTDSLRAAHASQFVYMLWRYHRCDTVELALMDSAAKGCARFRAHEQDLLQVEDGSIPFEELANRVEIDQFE